MASTQVEALAHSGSNGSPSQAEPLERRIERAARALDDDAITSTYFRQGEFIVIPNALPTSVIAELVSEVEQARASLVRRALPGFKHSASIGWATLREQAPSIAALYRSPGLRALIARIADAALVQAPDTDAHACAVYHYDRAGDGIGFHYDTSWYKGALYTLLIGLDNASTSRLVCELHRREPHRPQRRVEVATNPGTLVMFHGDKLRHSVTPLCTGERRIVLTLQYVTDPKMGFLGRVVSMLKDALAYFGFREVMRAMVATRCRGRSDPSN